MILWHLIISSVDGETCFTKWIRLLTESVWWLYLHAWNSSYSAISVCKNCPHFSDEIEPLSSLLINFQYTISLFIRFLSQVDKNYEEFLALRTSHYKECRILHVSHLNVMCTWIVFCTFQCCQKLCKRLAAINKEAHICTLYDKPRSLADRKRFVSLHFCCICINIWNNFNHIYHLKHQEQHLRHIPSSHISCGFPSVD